MKEIRTSGLGICGGFPSRWKHWWDRSNGKWRHLQGETTAPLTEALLVTAFFTVIVRTEDINTWTYQ